MNDIRKERIYLFAPAAHVNCEARFDRVIDKNELQRAIKSAVKANCILMSRVSLTNEGEARFEPANRANFPTLNDSDGDFESLIAENDSLPFDIENGESVRFFKNDSDASTRLFIIAHHIYTDGRSLMKLLNDVVAALNGSEIEYAGIRLLSPDDLPAHPKLTPPMRVMMKMTAARWRKQGRAFTFKDRDELMKRANAERPTGVICRTLANAVEPLKRFAHDNGATLNSLIAAACAEAEGDCLNLGIAVDVRPEGARGMANFATGASVKLSHDSAKPFSENVANAHKSIYAVINSPAKKFFLHEFMSALPATLIDSIQPCLYGMTDSPVAVACKKMCGYTDPPAGTSLTNIGNIEISAEAQKTARVTGVAFAPPYMSNVRRVLGVSGYNGDLTLASRFAKRDFESEAEYLNRVIHRLEALARE